MTLHTVRLAAFSAAVDLAAALGVENIGSVTRIDFRTSEVVVHQRLEDGTRQTRTHDITLPMGERKAILAERAGDAA
ncbi:hypothetical protein [Leifsonia aquatica]|uniref:hypothetical protein n=1 Tax=Leifsonia aquatica TaxID=144185 RepID=UPI00046A9628|nr:hypothetical protein [Leifsonia aquatica]